MPVSLPQRTSAAPPTLPDVLRRLGGGKCVDVAAGSSANGTGVQLYDCNGTGAQKWRHQSNGALLNPASGGCLDATVPSSANGTRLQIWDCTGGANQTWTLPV